jgi:Response regulator containing CheY-like receiver, AAA-type ATPase, and DNA-binding domains
MDKKRILVVEDNEVEGMILERTLRNVGYEVVRSTDGLDALENHLSQSKFDLVITDLMMPGLSGVELLYHAKARNVLPTAIVLTANSSDEASLKSLEIGAVDHLSKPLNLPLILAKLKVILGGKAA